MGCLKLPLGRIASLVGSGVEDGREGVDHTVPHGFSRWAVGALEGMGSGVSFPLVLPECPRVSPRVLQARPLLSRVPQEVAAAVALSHDEVLGAVLHWGEAARLAVRTGPIARWWYTGLNYSLGQTKVMEAGDRKDPMEPALFVVTVVEHGGLVEAVEVAVG